ncbi:hypothetical protein V1527DRAFT_517865 [Lipomyces starkeyi]
MGLVLDVPIYCQICASCRTLVCCETFQELQQMFVGNDGNISTLTKSLEAKVREQKDDSYDLDEPFETHEDFIECAQTENRELQRQAASHLRNDIFDCSERVNGPEFTLTCSRSQERKTDRDPVTVQRYTTMKEFFACRGELRITFSKLNQTATITYDHKCHSETQKFHVTEVVHQYIQAHQLLPPRLIYQNLIQMADSPRLNNTELHSITRQQVYNIWLSFTRKDWERDAANDFRSAQLLLEGQEGYPLIEGLQEPEVSLAFITPCFSDSRKLDRAKMTEVFIDSTFGTNKHGYELYCVLTEYDLVSLPLSYLLLLLHTRGVQEVGKGGTWLAAWFALRAAGLNPNVVHTDKDFAGNKY